MRVCCICKSSGVTKTHVVPKDKYIADLWFKAVPELSETKKRRPSLCQRHFKPEDYAGKKKIYLKPEVVPSVNLTASTEVQPRCENNRHQRLLKRIVQARKANKALREECRKRRKPKDELGGGKLQVAQTIFGGCDGSIKLEPD